ncbi:tetratricopeptide repeat protein [Wenyingzhuangia sp. 2_MG-2023]|uniref:type IX secretion system periplasmic lipoprotein PorW/SprE n=1 Tax=Wenyingzhuangia sp. 2_MG-2023 TaxID=3062639 RepID=UPI0026E2129A|nr:tetratricopeptide repeat protein [Wenyingzhuangia sp. 2_MG-2023]MDO6736743.1 tetratricopeptide repeat protein [Wenyingzhuangia sp. 2_MG-2023]
MKHYIFYISVLFLCSCSTHRDKFLNRKYHAFVTKYNVLYNGKLAYKKGLEKVEETYSDDFTELLPIEPFSFYANQDEAEDVAPIGQEDFKRAEEKAAKAIQRHSMLIKGEERNSQIDEAYLLLGKSRYYTKRFGPALESFEYIIKNYPEASLIYETVVWRAKSNIHIDNVDFGKKALHRLLTASTLPPETRQQAEIGLVMAYEKSPDSLSSVIKHLEASLKAVDKGTTASRVAFVLGQAYRKQGLITKSDKAFDKVIEMKRGLYRFKLQSKLEKINNHLEDFTTEKFLKELDHLIFVTKNRPYLGKLFYEKGLVYQEIDSMDLAKRYYTESVLKSYKDADQKILSYEKLGDLYYGEKKYEPAKSYYDSLVSVARNKNSKRVVRIQRKAKNLEKVVSIQRHAFANDSLLMIASLGKSDLEAYYKNHIEKIKDEEKELRKKELIALEKQNTFSFDRESDWYFFNNAERTKGKLAFVKKWRLVVKNKNWYSASLSSRSAVAVVEVDSLSKEKNVVAPTNNKYEVAYYTEQVKRDPKFIDSITKTRNLNYYELGNIYYSLLKEKELAVEKLEKLIAFNPSRELKIGAYYRLYKIYQETGDVMNENSYKQKLKQEYPNSSFTKLANKESYNQDLDEDVNEYIICYETIYELYNLNSFEAAKQEILEAIPKYSDTPLSAKYALLHAYIMAKVEGKETFCKLLSELKLRYPNSIEAKKAIEILNNK